MIAMKIMPGSVMRSHHSSHWSFVGGALLLIWFTSTLAIGRNVDADRKALYTNHVVRANEDGLALEAKPISAPPVISSATFRDHVERLLDLAEDWARRKPRGPGLTNTVPLLIHIHGGLNSWDATLERMDLIPHIMGSPLANDRYYPIFISWPSGPIDTYKEHIWNVRVGVRDRDWNRSVLTKATAPVQLATDFVKAAIGIPQAWGHQIINARDQFAYGDQGTNRTWIRNSKWLSQLFLLSQSNYFRATNDHFTIYRGLADSTTGETATRLALNVLKAPVYLTLGSLAQGEPSIAALRIMQRRTLNLYAPAQEFEWIHDAPGGDAIHDNSAMSNFFDLLIERIDQRAKANTIYEVTLVGHSMGAIALNNLLVRHADDWKRLGAIRQVTYMAAACSVREATTALTPLLLSCQGSGTCKQHMRFANLTLHAFADLSEAMGGGFVPAGSLLYQLDTHLQSPNTALDRTLGWDINVLSAIDEFQPIKEFCVFKSFDYDPGTIPMRHGDFSKCPFWYGEFLDNGRIPQKEGQEENVSTSLRTLLHRSSESNGSRRMGYNYLKTWSKCYVKCDVP